MGWEDRQHGSATDGRGGGRFRDSLRRMFGDGDNFLNWSFPLYTAWGIRVRVHLLFVLVVLGELIRSSLGNPAGGMGPVYVAIAMASLFGLVLLHEYGHCLACRRVGGEADQILLWPLGGLASCRPPHDWRAHLVTTLGGPTVNAILLPVLAGLLLALTGEWRTVVFPPFAPGSVLAVLRLATSSTQPMWLVAIWWMYYMNAVLLAFNLLPMYPLDGGKIMQEILWSRIGYRRSMRVAATSGLVAAVVVGVLAAVVGQTLLLGIALFAGLTCWMQGRQLKFEEAGEIPGYDFDRGFAGMPGAEEDAAGPSRAELKRLEREAAEQVEVDRILEKIARSGMASLTSKEKKALNRATERKRRS